MVSGNGIKIRFTFRVMYLHNVFKKGGQLCQMEEKKMMKRYTK